MKNKLFSLFLSAAVIFSTVQMPASAAELLTETADEHIHTAICEHEQELDSKAADEHTHTESCEHDTSAVPAEVEETHDYDEADKHQHTSEADSDQNAEKLSDVSTLTSATPESISTEALSSSARMTGTCPNCGPTTASYVYSYLNDSYHTVVTACDSCGYDLAGGVGGRQSHSFSGNTCTQCGYTKSCSHTSTSISYITGCDWEKTCNNCGTVVSTGTTHGPYTYADWKYYSDSQHRRSYTCSYGDSGRYYEYESHSTEAKYDQYNDTQHEVSDYCATCDTSLSTDYEDHVDDDGDGSCDSCAYEMTLFSVTVPTSMALGFSEDGEIYAADNAMIVNNSSGAVEITEISVNAEGDWSLVPYNYNMAKAKVDSHLLGFSIGSAQTKATGSSETLTLSDAVTIEKDGSLPLDYDAVVSATSTAITSEQVLTTTFVLDWAS